MKAVASALTVIGILHGGAVRADQYAVLEACLRLSSVFDDVTQVFGDDHNIDQKLDVLARLHSDYRLLLPLVMAAGGEETKGVIANFGMDQPKAIVGDVFSFPIGKATAQCKVPQQDRHSCSAIFDLLETTTAALFAACVNDFQKARN